MTSYWATLSRALPMKRHGGPFGSCCHGPSQPLEKASAQRSMKMGTLWKRDPHALTAKGWKAQIWCIIGDQEFFANHLKLGHKDAALEKVYKQISLEKQDFQVYTHAEHAVFTVPHVSCKNVRGDPLHILVCTGLYGHLIGSILHYICWYEGPGSARKSLGKGWHCFSTRSKSSTLRGAQHADSPT